MDDDDVALYLGGDGENELAAEDIVVVISSLLFHFRTNYEITGCRFFTNCFDTDGNNWR
jgi:hypothetical protein